MSAEKSVADISCRFGKDRLEIVEYVNFMRDQCAIHVKEVAELNSALKRFGLQRSSYPRVPRRQSPPHARRNQRSGWRRRPDHASD